MLTVQHEFSVHQHHQNHTPSYVRWFDFCICQLKSYRVAIEMKAFKNYFPAVLFLMLGGSLNLWLKPLRVTFHKKAITELALPCGAVFISRARWFHLFESVNENIEVWQLKCKLLNSTFLPELFVFRDLRCLYFMCKFGNFWCTSEFDLFWG